ARQLPRAAAGHGHRQPWRGRTTARSGAAGRLRPLRRAVHDARLPPGRVRRRSGTDGRAVGGLPGGARRQVGRGPVSKLAVRGNERTLESLAATVAREGFQRTLLFSGPDGVGRRQAAAWLAAFLNCLASPEERPC